MSARLPPRPGQRRYGATKLGALRDEYNATVEGHPPRFVFYTHEIGSAWSANYRYFEWAQRADEWARERERMQGR